MLALPFLRAKPDAKPGASTGGAKADAKPAPTSTTPAAAARPAPRPTHSTSTNRLYEHELARRLQAESELQSIKAKQASPSSGYQNTYTYPQGYALIPGQPITPTAPMYYAATPVYAHAPGYPPQGMVAPMQTYAQPYAPQGYIQPQQMAMTPPPVAQYPAPANQPQLYPLPPATGHPQQMAGYVVAQPQQLHPKQFQAMPAAPPHQPYVSSGSPLASAALSSSIIVANPKQLPVGAPLKTLPVTVGPPASVYSTANTYMSSGPASSAYSMPGRSDAPAQPPAVVRVPSVQHHQPAPAKKEDIEDGWELVGEDNSAVNVHDTVSSPLASSAQDQKATPATAAPAKPTTSPLGSSASKPSSPSLTTKGADSSSDTDSGSVQLHELELDTDMYIAWSDISLGRELGSGHFGAVYEAAWRGTTPVAVKMLHAHLKGDAIRNFADEAKVWLRIPPHPNIVQFFGLSHSNASLTIITELLEGGSLLSFLQDPKSNLSLQQMLNISKNICAGMWHLHCASIVHRDLAARNILVGGYLPRSKTFIVKVSDFGLSRHCVGTAKQKTLIPFKWSAPESIGKSLFSTASDVWSLGVVLSEVFSQGEAPYPDLTEEQTVARIKLGYRMPKPLDCPAEVYDIMLTCWRMDPAERPTMQELCAQLDKLEQRAAAGEVGLKPMQPATLPQKKPAAAPAYVGDVPKPLPAVPQKKAAPVAAAVEERLDGRGYIVTP